MTHRRTFIRLVTIAAVAALMLFATVPIAFAATGDPAGGGASSALAGAARTNARARIRKSDRTVNPR